MRVGKTWTFEAAHNLVDYPGGPEPVHGHTYRLEVALEGPVGPQGMVLDFVELDRVMRERVLARLDHAFLNDVVPQSSTENLAGWIWRQLKDLPLAEVKLWEGPDSYVVYTGE